MQLVINGPRALVVDDEPAVARVVARLLQRQGYRCESVLDPEEALHRVRQSSFDLIVSDLRMPEKNGIDLLAEIVELRPETATVLLTGWSDEATQARARTIGVDAFLSKACEEDEIKSCIADALLNKTLRLASRIPQRSMSQTAEPREGTGR